VEVQTAQLDAQRTVQVTLTLFGTYPAAHVVHVNTPAAAVPAVHPETFPEVLLVDDEAIETKSILTALVTEFKLVQAAVVVHAFGAVEGQVVPQTQAS